jgi:octaprenyl-diphosphate synthase
VRKAIEEGGREMFPEVLAAVKGSGALEAARSHAQAEAQIAVDSIAQLPASIYKNALIELPAFSVVRRF